MDQPNQAGESADRQFLDYLRAAERGRLLPDDFTHLEKLLPRVSASLRAFPTRKR